MVYRVYRVYRVNIKSVKSGDVCSPSSKAAEVVLWTRLDHFSSS